MIALFLFFDGPVQVLLAKSASQLVLDGCDVGEGAIVGFAWRFRANIRRRNDVQLMAQMVERHQAVVKGEDTIGQSQVILGALRQAFKLTHHVIGEIANTTGGEGRQIRNRRGTILPQVLAQQLDHAPLAALDVRALANRQLPAPRRNYPSWLRAKERVTPDLLSAFDRLQQEGILLPLGDAQEGPDRSQQIGAQSFHHWDERGVAAELQETLVVGRDHRVL